MRQRFFSALPDGDFSPGAAFLLATARAIPATAGDRERVGILESAVLLALESKFQFKRGDGEILDRLAFRTFGSTFDVLSDRFYEIGCIYGGTYPSMWEAHRGRKPWIGHRVVAREPKGFKIVELEDNRVTAGMAILLPGDVRDDDLLMCRHGGRQVWWCTSLDNDTITMCRYEAHSHAVDGLQRGGSPIKRVKYSRSEWNALQAVSVTDSVERSDREQSATVRPN